MQQTTTSFAEATNFNWHTAMSQGLEQNLDNQLSTNLSSDFQQPIYQSSSYSDPNLGWSSTSSSNLGYGTSYDPIVMNTQNVPQTFTQTQYDKRVTEFASKDADKGEVKKDEASKLKESLKSKDEKKDISTQQKQPSTQQQQTTTQQQVFTQQQQFLPETQTNISYLNAPLATSSYALAPMATSSYALAPMATSSYALAPTTTYTNTVPVGASYWSYPVLFPGTSTMIEDKIIEIYYPQSNKRGLWGRRGKKGAASNAYSYPVAPPMTTTTTYQTMAPASTFSSPISSSLAPFSTPAASYLSPASTSLSPLNTSLNPMGSSLNRMATMNPMNQLNPFTTAPTNVPSPVAPIRAM